jgi:hypothetical protein
MRLATLLQRFDYDIMRPATLLQRFREICCHRFPRTVIFITTISQSLHVKGIIVSYNTKPPPLWSSGQSSWLQIRRPGFDSRHYQKKLGLERGPLSLVSTTEELLDRKVAAPV